MTEPILNVALVGCGNIAGSYLRALSSHPEIRVVGVTDLDPSRAEALAALHGCHAYPSLDDLLADDNVQLAVNLTIHHAHKEVTERCLKAGKHVHSEKPLALNSEDAWYLVDLARQQGVRLSSSPFSWMGEAQQSAWKLIREGRLGTVRVVYSEVNWGRIEVWHPAPGPFYAVGALWDVGVYSLAFLTAMFGPARRVTSYGHMLKADRVTKEGIPFHITTPDFMVSMIELESGPVIRLTTNFYVSGSKQGGLEIHGDDGSLALSTWHDYNGLLEFGEFGKAYEPVPLVREPYPGVQWSRSLVEMAHAIAEGRPHRATGEHAAHIVDILCAAEQSVREGRAVDVSSTFTPPEPMEWAVGPSEQAPSLS